MKTENLLNKIFIPPVKIQGIKTKLIDFIAENIYVQKDSTWYEPFMGSGVVGINLAPYKAVFSDINPYVIQLYNHIKLKKITSKDVRDFLEYEGALLKKYNENHYYEVRDRFNEFHNPLDFLFLNRSCFNGMIRFNKQFKFNTPYCRKPDRFSKAYITKICNQVNQLENLMSANDWEFKCCSFEEIITAAGEKDFIYCDPPYTGRHVDYYDSWNEEQEISLRNFLFFTKAHFMLSTWDRNKYRNNEYINNLWKGCYKLNKEHFYHIGGFENNRHSMLEALLLNYNPKHNSQEILRLCT